MKALNILSLLIGVPLGSLLVAHCYAQFRPPRPPRRKLKTLKRKT